MAEVLLGLIGLELGRLNMGNFRSGFLKRFITIGFYDVSTVVLGPFDSKKLFYFKSPDLSPTAK